MKKEPLMSLAPVLGDRRRVRSVLGEMVRAHVAAAPMPGDLEPADLKMA